MNTNERKDESRHRHAEQVVEETLGNQPTQAIERLENMVRKLVQDVQQLKGNEKSKRKSWNTLGGGKNTTKAGKKFERDNPRKRKRKGNCHQAPICETKETKATPRYKTKKKELDPIRIIDKRKTIDQKTIKTRSRYWKFNPPKV